MTDEEGPVPAIARVVDGTDLDAAVRTLGLSGGRPVVVLVGGAGGMGDAEVQELAGVLSAAVVPVLGDDGAVVDGGTDAGVMRAAGLARVGSRLGWRLVGVAAEGTVAAPFGTSSAVDAHGLEPGHTHALLVPGSDWGDESPWIGRVADAIAEGHPSVTVLANGGAIAGEDVERGLGARRPVIVLAGTGRLSDEIAAAGGSGDDSSASRIADSDLTAVVDMHDHEAVRSAVAAALRPPGGSPSGHAPTDPRPW